MSPEQEAALASAIISLVAQLISQFQAAKAGTLDPQALLSQVQGYMSDDTASEQKDDAAAQSTLDQRFPK